ncbi:hypothetical protein AAHZ94_15100 [Streptomyces sp. HSW2009]|uniref:hypothetical protein n=1 Tax=Streptomyces sp. HSW2009 TaxID=3142890 RepID=UPI0032EE02D7
MNGTTKGVLWLLFGLCVGINVIIGVTFDGGLLEIVFSAMAGLCAFAAGAGLLAARRAGR